MILFGYTDNQGTLLGNGESRYKPWGSSFWGPSVPVGMSFPLILGIELKVHSAAQDEVLLSRWSLFCFLLPAQPSGRPGWSKGGLSTGLLTEHSSSLAIFSS